MSGLEAALTAGRTAAEALLVDTIRMWRPGPDVFDRETGQMVPGPPAAEFWTGRARVKVAQISAEQVQAGEQEVQLRQYRVSLPFDVELPAGRPEPGDLIDVTASPDPRMAGLRLWIVGVQYSGTATAWRIIAEDRQAGERG